MKFDSLSRNIVNILFELSKNEGLARLLVHEVGNPFDPSLPAINKNNLIIPSSGEARIFPYPFDSEATVEDGCFIRAYYNTGQLGAGEIIAESEIHIDIIVAKSLWLISDNMKKSLIRPYEIMGRVTDMIGSRSNNTTIKLKFEGFQHLYVNPKFDCIRLYANYMSVEAWCYAVQGITGDRFKTRIT